MTYPVVELFHSPQGEGMWAGTAMTFVRLAGCNVGKPVHNKHAYGVIPEGQLPVWAEECGAWDGKPFICDTNFRMKERLSVDQILARVRRERICLTGGEPLMHEVLPLLREAWARKHIVHIETSGTFPVAPLRELSYAKELWICISPKRGYMHANLKHADEIKVLVDHDFDEDKFVAYFGSYIEKGNVLISPVNDMENFNKENAARCLKLQDVYPKLRISIQMHKALACR